MRKIPGLGKAIAIVIRRLRNQAGWTQNQLADFSSLSRGAIAKIEGHKGDVAANTLYLLAEAFRISFPELINRIYEQLQADNESSVKLEEGANTTRKKFAKSL